MSVPADLTPEALFKWQADLEDDLVKVLTEWTEVALITILQQALVGDLTAASARFRWEEAVDQTLQDLDLADDPYLATDLKDALIGDEAFEVVQQVLALRLPEVEQEDALLEVLDLSASLVASGISDLDLEAEANAVFKGWLNEKGENWVEQTGTGHLPKYIRAIADALMRNGYNQQRAIATAVNTVKRWAKGGPARKGGKGSVTKGTQAKAIKALMEWEKKRIEAKATALQPDTIGQFALQIPNKVILKWKTKIKREVRTAFTGVANRAILGILRVRGVKLKTWVTKRDSRVRPTHRDADGQTVPMEAHFRVGRESLMYPGERGKLIEEIANCRCIIVPG